jgi:hypothetical protein
LPRNAKSAPECGSPEAPAAPIPRPSKPLRMSVTPHARIIRADVGCGINRASTPITRDSASASTAPSTVSRKPEGSSMPIFPVVRASAGTSTGRADSITGGSLIGTSAIRLEAWSHSAQLTRRLDTVRRRSRRCQSRVTPDRCPDRPIRPKRIAQDRQLLLNRPAAPAPDPPNKLDTTTHTTGRMSGRYICN